MILKDFDVFRRGLRVMADGRIRGSITGPVSQALRQTIRERGLTAYSMAELAGVSVDAIQRFLNCDRGLTLATVDKLASSLGLTLCQEESDNGHMGVDLR